MNQSRNDGALNERFLDFGLTFFSMLRRHYCQENQVKAHTQSFYALMQLNQLEGPPPIMSELAQLLDIPKQQLTRMVNDLEEKGLVRREHDKKNRRQVYLIITPEGKQAIAQLRASMLTATAQGLAVFSPEELAQLDESLLCLSRLLPRFHPELPVLETDSD